MIEVDGIDGCATCGDESGCCECGETTYVKCTASRAHLYPNDIKNCSCGKEPTVETWDDDTPGWRDHRCKISCECGKFVEGSTTYDTSKKWNGSIA